ncbi:unnamed protein product [Lepeophtheirus salmonis]|uniref:(salmon louse) hypothetical protein n=1 Tax=Lepeophtheirus salmonis TaxID=72036 RepID=A0A7R8CV62_LEPSM|nr:unnamed protein product [Lepeophtheirus salmonis]CAF2942344.1 unnamed protein product [Lepeophtheirus salmonis]
MLLIVQQLCCSVFTLSFLLHLPSAVESFLREEKNPGGITNSAALFEKYFDWKLKTWPTWASMKGYHDYDSEWEDLSLSGFEKRRSDIKDFYEEVQNILSDSESTDDNHFLNVLKWELGIALEGYQWKHFVFSNSNFLSGIFREIPLVFSARGCLRWTHENNTIANLKKLKKVPRLLIQVHDLLSYGMHMGLSYSAEAFDRIDFDNINQNQLKEMFGRSPNRALKKEAFEVIDEQVIPALQYLGNFIQESYQVRSHPGISSLPNGKERYEAILKYHTNIEDVTAHQVHEMGLKEVASIRADFLSDIKRVLRIQSLGNMTVEDIFRKAREHPNGLREIYPKLKNIFHQSVLDELALVNVISDSKTGLSYYKTSSFDGSRNGSFIIGTQVLGNQLKFTAMPLSLHEAVPGHHLQFSYSQGQKFPKFLQNSLTPDFAAIPGQLGSPTSFIEGWGLYSEFLGLEMGLFEENPLQLIGYYSFSLLRASRLVVDTGLHGLGWSRHKAIRYLDQNTGFTHSANSFSIDRYIVWPGQATSYKIGEMKIRDLRVSLSETLSDRFDIKDFHSAVLDCYGPLHLLERCIRSKME